MRQENIGVRDRDIRLILGAALAVLAVFILQGVWAIVAGVLSLVMFATAAMSFCPLYRLVGFSTKEKPEAEPQA